MKRERQRRKPEEQAQRQVHIYAGDPSTLAILELGLTVDRAMKSKRVCVVHFMGNAAQAANLGKLDLPVPIDICKCETEDQLREACSVLGNSETARQRLVHAREALSGGQYDLVVLAEVTTAIACRYVSARDIAELIDQKAAETELVLTGSCIDRAVADLADTVTELVPGHVKVDIIDTFGLEYWRAEDNVLEDYVRRGE